MTTKFVLSGRFLARGKLIVNLNTRDLGTLVDNLIFPFNCCYRLDPGDDQIPCDSTNCLTLKKTCQVS